MHFIQATFQGVTTVSQYSPAEMPEVFHAHQLTKLAAGGAIKNTFGEIMVDLQAFYQANKK